MSDDFLTIIKYGLHVFVFQIGIFEMRKEDFSFFHSAHILQHTFHLEIFDHIPQARTHIHFLSDYIFSRSYDQPLIFIFSDPSNKILQLLSFFSPAVSVENASPEIIEYEDLLFSSNIPPGLGFLQSICPYESFKILNVQKVHGQYISYSSLPPYLPRRRSRQRGSGPVSQEPYRMRLSARSWGLS